MSEESQSDYQHDKVAGFVLVILMAFSGPVLIRTFRPEWDPIFGHLMFGIVISGALQLLYVPAIMIFAKRRHRSELSTGVLYAAITVWVVVVLTLLILKLFSGMRLQ